MANPEHVAKAKEGVEAWNAWREQAVGVIPDLSGADLTGLSLKGANLDDANLVAAILDQADLYGSRLVAADASQAVLTKVNLAHADLSSVKLIGADLYAARLFASFLWYADLSEANLRKADLTRAGLNHANLAHADLAGADLSYASLVETNVEGAIFSDCRIFGVSAWGLLGEPKKQTDLLITWQYVEPRITVDDLEVAQFVYMLLVNRRLRKVIESISSKIVLILGSFLDERKAVLEAIRKELRKSNYTPVLVDFAKPGGRDLIETVRTMAHLSRFIIADISRPRSESVAQELQAIVPDLEVPVQPLLQEGSGGEYGTFESFGKYHWVLPVYEYSDLRTLLASLPEKVVGPAELKFLELQDGSR